MGIRDKVAQSATFVDPRKVRTLADRSLLFDEVTTAIRAITVADTPYSVDAGLDPDLVILADASGGAITIDLPAASTVGGHHYWIKRIEASVNVITIDPYSAETIDGASTYALDGGTTAGVHILCDGTNWHVVGEPSYIVAGVPAGAAWAVYTTGTKPAATAPNAYIPYIVDDPGVPTRAEMVYQKVDTSYDYKTIWQALD